MLEPAAGGSPRVTAVALLAAPEGLKRLAEAFPGDHPATIRVVTAAVDERLDERGYIFPGLGDAGDCLFGASKQCRPGGRPPGTPACAVPAGGDPPEPPARAPRPRVGTSPTHRRSPGPEGPARWPVTSGSP